MSDRLAQRLQAVPHDQPLDPSCAAPSRWRHYESRTILRNPQAPTTKSLAPKAQTRRSQYENYLLVILKKRNNLCILVGMDATKALQALAAMSGRDVITQTDAAQALGVSGATISRREKFGWPLADLLALADAFGVSRTRLMLQLGFLDGDDLYEVVGDGSLEGVPLSALTSELHKRATNG